MTYKRKPKQVVHASGIASELAVVYREAQDLFLTSRKDVGRLKSLRPSQLPFCPVRFFINHATQGLVQTQDMNSAFYTEVGTAVHSVVQKYLAHSGRFLANWECKQCHKRYTLTMQHECCDFPMVYHEVELDFKGVVGHIDAIFKDKKGRYWIVDFKTTSVKGAAYKLKSPGVSYVEQVETYALMIGLQYNIKIHGVVLIFIKRDNPAEPVIWQTELNDKDYARIKARTIKYKRQHKQVMSVSTLAEARALAKAGKCVDPWCDVCKSRVPIVKQLETAFKRGLAKKRIPLKGLK
jgi:hypothetical protein